MRWKFHDLTIEGATNAAAVRERWQMSFASLRPGAAAPDLSFSLNLVSEAPPRPQREPQFRQGDLLEYHLEGRTVIAHFPRFGQLRLDLANGATEGQIVADVLTTYGVLEDLIAIGLSPHLRRRGLFLIHAFAAADPHPRPLSLTRERGVLLVGGIGSGKTTTGMSLLNAGWQLLSNDSPILNSSAEVLSYPGLLAAYPDTFARFEATAGLAQTVPTARGRQKLTLAAEEVWPDVWLDRAPAGAIFFPHIEARADHALEPLNAPEALRRLLPHAVEQWDRELIPEHLKVLRALVEAAPAYLLRLGSEVRAIPALINKVMSDEVSR
ncbi:MAG TPA: hypothetical protein VJG32_07225 [Anaerolineae bacterium]|nr:hypothetical protein [Anaerolineae bacterium]